MAIQEWTDETNPFNSWRILFHADRPWVNEGWTSAPLRGRFLKRPR